ncbi:hypothetical protein [Rhodocyclus tenuis]|uniref:Uncharacterized protein n=1 Tax=Rhodocyclus tenuis TaxID=1066 RepID=A0A840GDB3_RHOTE|nr:hypothetical protein [Rhodocyclus tenuis]MBB4246542.1 hypothetical protein [Rhodocyclus tenuis]
MSADQLLALLAEFNGSNHAELAIKYRITTVQVHRLVAQLRHAALRAALLASVENSAQVLVAFRFQQEFLSGTEAVLQAVQKARAAGYEDRLVLALHILAAAPAATAPDSGSTPPAAPEESQSAPQAHPDTAPLPSAPLKSSLLPDASRIPFQP